MEVRNSKWAQGNHSHDETDTTVPHRGAGPTARLPPGDAPVPSMRYSHRGGGGGGDHVPLPLPRKEWPVPQLPLLCRQVLG